MSSLLGICYCAKTETADSFSRSHQLTYIVGGLQIFVRSIRLDRSYQMEYIALITLAVMVDDFPFMHEFMRSSPTKSTIRV